MYLELMKPNAEYYEYDADGDYPLNFDEICKESMLENMAPLCPEQIAKHLFGVALVGTWWSPHGVQHTEVVSYAAITGIEEWNAKPHATIGGVLTPKYRRGKGYATQTVQALIDAANLSSFSDQYEYHGFVAKCNGLSAGLFEKLGFRVLDEEGDKVVMKKFKQADPNTAMMARGFQRNNIQ